MTPEYCTQNNGDCVSCSLANYGRDCTNTPFWTLAAVAETIAAGNLATMAKLINDARPDGSPQLVDELQPSPETTIYRDWLIDLTVNRAADRVGRLAAEFAKIR